MVIKKPKKQEVLELRPSVWIGKKGLDSMVIEEIKHQLKKKGYIKVKILKNIRHQFDNILKQILSQTKADLIYKRGLTFVLFKKSE